MQHRLKISTKYTLQGSFKNRNSFRFAAYFLFQHQNILSYLEKYLNNSLNILLTNFQGDYMFNLKEKLEFLEDGIDFPFYNDIPKLSSKEWGILAIAVIVFFLLTYMPWIIPQYRFFVYFLIMIIPAIYVCKGDYSIFFKKLKLRDAKTIILCYILYIIYAFAVSATLFKFCLVA